MKPVLALTMGDTNGIGPEILAKALCRQDTWDACTPVVFGSAGLLRMLLDRAPDSPPLRVVDSVESVETERRIVHAIECGMEAPPWSPGELTARAGRCAVEWLKEAVRQTMAGKVAGIVTCPLNKEGIHLAGYEYPGHTEIIAEMTGSPDYRMCLFADTMRIVHISAHSSIAEAVKLVETDRIVKSIRIGRDSLVRLGLPRGRIAVAGLNPHAGEAGAIGTEEIERIAPAVEICRSEGIDCSGPYPPDTVFLRMHEGEFDLVVAMYHDQGHIPLKLIAMDRGVNVTLGIPIIRTSVDHGTAYDKAGTGKAREDSLCAAIALAARFAGLESK